MIKSLIQFTFAAAIALTAIVAQPAAAANIGPKKCQECHRAEHDVWKGTAHFKAYRGAHKNKSAKAIAAASGTGKSMRKNKTCMTCHYTKIGEKSKAGPSCESCHGSASKWVKVHNDLGAGVKSSADESPAHKKKRLAAAKKAGMIHSSMLYDIAENCNGCHTMQNIDAGMAGKLIDAGHPINGSYELVKYSQGQVRHRFYPPNVTKNQKMNKAELSRLFLTGHAAGLVFATKVLKTADNAKYKAAMEQRIASAKKAIGAAKGSVSQAGALLSSPTESNARKFVAALQGKDLSGAVGGMLPSKYK
jgi:cytochrome c2